MNITMLLEMASSGFADRVAVQEGDSSLTYAQLFAAAGSAARALRESGCEHLALLDSSSPAVAVALFASAWAGVPYVPLNYRLTGDELDALLERVTPTMLVTDAERAADLTGREGITAISSADFLEQSASGEPLAEPWAMDGDDIAILLFTSGTTGAPKAAVLRHRHLVSYIFSSVEFGGAADSDAALVSVPPYHIAGVASLLSSVYSARRVVQLPAFSAGEWLRLAREQQVTNAFVVPTMLSRIMEELENNGETDAGLPALAALSYGGGKMPLPVIEKAMRFFPGTGFTNAYGLTETSSTITLLDPDDHRSASASDDPAVKRRLVSVGRPQPGVELQVRNDEGATLGANESGEIYVRGEQVSGEYLGLGTRVEGDGWFPTRDGGSIDEEGYLFIEGRVDDVIVRGGENMSPGEIEDVLLEHPSVVDVAVVGVPSVEWGEAVAAMVVARGERPPVEDLQSLVMQRLRSSRVPGRIEFIDELPYNETGKLLRRRVRELLADSAAAAE